MRISTLTIAAVAASLLSVAPATSGEDCYWRVSNPCPSIDCAPTGGGGNGCTQQVTPNQPVLSFYIVVVNPLEPPSRTSFGSLNMLCGRKRFCQLNSGVCYPTGGSVSYFRPSVYMEGEDCEAIPVD